MKVLLAVDGSEYTKRMLGFLAAHPEFLEGRHEFTALTAVWPITPRAQSFLSRPFVVDYYESSAKEILDPVEAFAKQKRWQLSSLSKVGNPSEVIADVAASGHYDLIVMGSRGHSAVLGLVLGSVVTNVLARVKTPVLIVR